ncbi:hypothetical protein CC86DRAFT_367624 [Ophiobolus disseminans]|uniref:C2H2-type domain-containing protein n=1 Tax=Ophiobolus disseminans TaxID=1469910 RepID=A0A6A7AAH7_9PLEO|nr:hypothetical protein CC86DRAFT_367624 [Ophiobolus disseminans]
MRSTLYLSIFITLLHCVTGNGKPTDSLESPFGLSFSPSAILASRFNSSGIIEVTQYPTSPKYQTYYKDAVTSYGETEERRTYDYYESATHKATIAMFRQIVDPVTLSLTKYLGHEPTYATLFIPSVFNVDLRTAAIDAVFGEDHLKRPTKYGTTDDAACHAYDFFACKHLNRAPSECNWNGPENLILHLVYEQDYLYAFFKEVAFHLKTYPVGKKEICKRCGERFRDALGAQAHNAHINHFLTTFVNLSNSHYYSRDEIRAIVISGEASAESIAALERIARKAVGVEPLDYAAEIDAAEVAAYGAAEYARITQRDPETFTMEKSTVTPVHDEL